MQTTTLVLGTGATVVAAVAEGTTASEADWEIARATGMLRDAEAQGATETWLVRAVGPDEADLDADPAVIAYSSREWTRAGVEELERSLAELERALAASRDELDAHAARAAAALAAAQAGRVAYIARDADGVHFASED